MNIGTYELNRISQNPEQYEVLIEGKNAGYFQLVNGIFLAKSVADGQIIYKAHVNDIDMEEERPAHLYNALARLQLHLIKLEFSQKNP